MRILICDDEPSIIEQLQKYLTEYFSTVTTTALEVLSFDNGQALLAQAGDNDIIFLDIEMPEVNGIDVGRQIMAAHPNTIIFVITSYIEYLDDAMRFHVFRYLTKPLDKDRLFQNMQDALLLYNSVNIKIPIETRKGIFVCATSDIIFVEAQKRSITVHTTDGNYRAIRNMNHWAEVLNLPCFFQSHRSYIVNMRYVTYFDHSMIYLCQQYTAYLTKRKYSQFKELYLFYLESMR